MYDYVISVIKNKKKSIFFYSKENIFIVDCTNIFVFCDILLSWNIENTLENDMFDLFVGDLVLIGRVPKSVSMLSKFQRRKLHGLMGVYVFIKLGFLKTKSITDFFNNELRKKQVERHPEGY